MSDIERLVAVEDIRVLCARRNRYSDAKEWDALEALHAPEHHSSNDFAPPWTSAAETIANTRAILERVHVVHQSYSPEITVESPSKASGVWGMTVIAEWTQEDEQHWYIGVGYLFETYEKRDGKWLFTSRRETLNFVKRSPGGILPTEERPGQAD
jgi:hypothetical protein